MWCLQWILYLSQFNFVFFAWIQNSYKFSSFCNPLSDFGYSITLLISFLFFVVVIFAKRGNLSNRFSFPLTEFCDSITLLFSFLFLVVIFAKPNGNLSSRCFGKDNANRSLQRNARALLGKASRNALLVTNAPAYARATG